MKLIETDGIVLKTMDFKENDSILTFLTPEAGKIAGVLHGGKSARSGNSAKTELFVTNHFEFGVKTGAELVRIRKCELLETLEVVFRKSGAEDQILGIIGGIHKSRQRAVPASLLYAKLLYLNNQLDEASKVLGQVNIPSSTNKDQKTFFGTKENSPQLNEKWRSLNHAIRFLIAIRQERSEDALNEAKPLLQEEILN